MTDTESGTYQKPGDYRNRILSWLFQQGISTVLLTAQAASILWVCWYVIDQGIPKALDQIQSGYLKIEEHHDQHLRLIIDTFEKSANRNKTQVRPSATTSDEIYEEATQPFPCG